MRLAVLILGALLMAQLTPHEAIAGPPELQPQRKSTSIEEGDYVWMMEKAVALSGLSPIPREQWPNMIFLSREELAREVCPEDPSQCGLLAAAYDFGSGKLVVWDQLNMRDDADASFVVHELTHALQDHHTPGLDIENDCVAVLKLESEAYKVQNKFLKSRGQLVRYQTRRFKFCPGLDRVTPEEFMQLQAQQFQ